MNRGGLTQLSSGDLRKLARLVYKKEISCPFKRSDLLMRGLNSLADHAEPLIEQKAEVVLLVISTVLAERSTLELVMESRIRQAIHHHVLDTQNIDG